MSKENRTIKKNVQFDKTLSFKAWKISIYSIQQQSVLDVIKGDKDLKKSALEFAENYDTDEDEKEIINCLSSRIRFMNYLFW